MNILSKALIGLIAFLLPLTALAHVKWFVEGDNPPIPDENTALYLIVWALIALVVVAIGIWLDKYLQKKWRHKRHISERVHEKIDSVFGLIIGGFFLIASYQGFIFSVDISHLGIYQTQFIWLQALIGASFLIGFAVRVSALALIAFWIGLAFYIGPLHMLEALWVLAVGIFAFIRGRTFLKTKSFIPDRVCNRYCDYALPILRVFVGIDLIILGFSEKILHPELALNFLAQYDWNFMQNIFGLEWFTDYLFVLSAGSMEALFGLIFVLGIVTRINALAIGIIFTIPMFILGPSELIGHMPHFTIVAMLLLFGAGSKLRLVNPNK